MTLLLACVTPRFVVLASDRRLTYVGGNMVEDIANKATMLCRHATFAYTGLAQCSSIERTDQLMLRCLSKQEPFDRLLAGLAKEAEQGIRNLRLAVPHGQRRSIRRTSFVGAGFLAVRRVNISVTNAPPTKEQLQPFLAVVSNAQSLTEDWRPEADQDFKVYMRLMDQDQPFILHAAGQPFTRPERVTLERNIRRSLDKISRPESLARLLARAIRTVAARNSSVGKNVMCTMVFRDTALSPGVEFRGGAIPLIPEVQNEASYFRWMRGQDPGNFIYSPGNPGAVLYYGPNYTCNGFMATGMQFGPAPLTPLPPPPTPVR